MLLKCVFVCIIFSYIYCKDKTSDDKMLLYLGLLYQFWYVAGKEVKSQPLLPDPKFEPQMYGKKTQVVDLSSTYLRCYIIGMLYHSFMTCKNWL